MYYKIRPERRCYQYFPDIVSYDNFDIMDNIFLTATMPSKAKIDRPTWLPKRGQKPLAWQNSKSNVFTEQLPRCACHNLAARRNCWGPNKLWDESRSEGKQNYSLCIKNDESSCVCRCINSGVPCSTGMIFNSEECRQDFIFQKLFWCEFPNPDLLQQYEFHSQ